MTEADCARRFRRGLPAVGLMLPVLGSWLTGCGDDDQCHGERSGDVTIGDDGIDVALPGGGSAGIGSVFADDSPPHISLVVGPATDDQDATARHIEVGDAFRVAGTTYTLRGFCSDGAYLDRDGR